MVSSGDVVTANQKETENHIDGPIQALRTEEDEANCLVIDEEASTSNDDVKANGDSGDTVEEPPKKNGIKRKASDDEVIMLDDAEEKPAEPAPKQPKTENGSDQQASPVPDDPTTHISLKKEEASSQKDSKDVKPNKGPELTNSEALLNRIEEYIEEAIQTDNNVQRKVLDALLGAINVQVQKEPLSVRKLILDKQLVLPNTISFPPSQVVDLVIEHDPDFPLSKVLTKMFGEERPKHSETEKKERTYLKQNFAAPHMTRLLTEIGQELVQEATYCDIVHAKNLPEAPKNMETYKQVASQLKPVWEQLKRKNEPFKQKLITCQACSFRTESRLVMVSHRSQLHHDGRKFQCGFCGETDTNENRMMKHYLDVHEIVATQQEQPLKHPCYICDEDFQYKGQRDQHMRAICKRDFAKLRYVMAPKNKEDVSAINTWLWEKPPVDPTILAQQQQNQREQQAKQKLQQQAAAQLIAAQREQQKKQQAMQLLHQQQQLFAAQKRLLAQQTAVTNNRSPASGSSTQPSNPQGQSLIAAMQRHLASVAQQQSQQSRPSTSGVVKPMLGNNSALFQRQLQQKSGAASISKPSTPAQNKAMGNSLSAATLSSMINRSSLGNNTSLPFTPPSSSQYACEICDQSVPDRERYLTHLQVFHKQMKGKQVTDMQQGAPLACSRCKERFWTYEGLERHLVMSHGLVTSDLLGKAQRREDGGRCKHCSKQYAFNMLQHLVAEHQVKLCSAEIMYSCDVCAFKCASYQQLESHLNTVHPKGGSSDAEKSRPKTTATVSKNNGNSNGDEDNDVVTLD